jgi:hypothetical protein
MKNMNELPHMKRLPLILLFAIVFETITAQSTAVDNSKYPRLTTFTAQQDQANMMQQLGIKKLRPGRSGNDKDPNHANYDEALANPCPQLPDVLSLNNGKKITTADQWWKQRRPELVEEFEREVYGRIPNNVPKVTWTVKIADREVVNRIPVIAKEIIGHVDNSDYPLINVDIKMVLVLPANVKGPVPVLIMFGRPSLPAPAQPSPEDMERINAAYKEMLIKSDPSMKELFEKYPAYQPITRLPAPNFFAPAKPDEELTPQERLLAAGWGYVTIDPSTIQPDNGAGLTRGIIGLTNMGQPRKPDQWGALRAWGWGASRALDYLETEPLVNAKQVGIEGVSRYGKAALVTMAFDQRFAVGLIGSSGKGGATLHRRVFGEAVENLTGGGGYHWMAGNYLKFGAEESSFGRKTGCDLPVDSHELIALCAPRVTFISYGIPEKGDANWLDQKGSYQATIAAGTVFKLLGAKDLGVSNDYLNEKMPPMLTDMLNGQLAWRQHDGGHTDAPNYKYFIPWASKWLNYERKTL